MNRHEQPRPVRSPLIHVYLSLTVPRQVGWLLTGAAVSHPHTLLGVARNAGHLLRLLSG